MNEELSGIVGSPVTPFKQDGSLDLGTLAKQVEFLIANDIDAITYPMHISESLNLSEDERKLAAKKLVDVVAGRVPTFINVSASGTRIGINLAEHAAKVGSTGVVVLGPYYWAPTPDDMLDHVATIANAHGGGLLVYNSPPVTGGASLSIDFFQKLLDRAPGFAGIKDASFNMDTFTGYCEMASRATKPISVFTGIEHMLTSMPVGSAGSLSAVSEITPGLSRKLYNACRAGNWEEARGLQYTMYRLFGILLRSYPSTIKFAMELMGRSTGPVRAPLPLLSDAEKEAAKTALLQLGVLDSEPRGWA